MLMLASLSQPLWGVAQKHAPRHCHWCLRTLTPWGLTPTKGSFLRPSVDVQKGLDSLTFQAASAALGCVMWAEPGDVGPEEDWMSSFFHSALSLPNGGPSLVALPFACVL